jgi:hypothetical protein
LVGELFAIQQGLPKSIRIIRLKLIYELSRPPFLWRFFYAKKEFVMSGPNIINAECNTLKIIINKPVAQVFEFSTNPKNTHLWFQSIKEEMSSEYPAKVGTIYRNRCSEENKWNEMVVSALIPNELFELFDNDSYHVRYTYRKLYKNTTEFTYCEWVDQGRLTGDLIADQSVLDKLKKLMDPLIKGSR